MTNPAQMTPPPPAGETRPASTWTRLTLHPAFISLLLATATLVVFLPTVRHDFVTYDDPDYVTTNPHVQGGLTRDAVVWAFRTGHSGNWHPLTWLSHMLDCQLYGLEPAGHHLTSLLFHALNTMLLYILLRRLTGAVWRSAFVAALFALHPLHVESFVWVSERKDVLSACFFFLTLWAYARCGSPRSKVQCPKSGDTQHATRNTLLPPLPHLLRPRSDVQADAGDSPLRPAPARLLAAPSPKAFNSQPSGPGEVAILSPQRRFLRRRHSGAEPGHATVSQPLSQLTARQLPHRLRPLSRQDPLAGQPRHPLPIPRPLAARRCSARRGAVGGPDARRALPKPQMARRCHWLVLVSRNAGAGNWPRSGRRTIHG